jgi:hypothetical protein
VTELANYPAETRALIFGTQKAQALEDLEKVILRHTGISQPVAAPSPWAAMTLPTVGAGVVGQLIGGAPMAALASSSALLAPAVLTRALSSPVGIRYLTRGFQPNMTAQGVARLIEQIGGQHLTNAMTGLPNIKIQE